MNMLTGADRVENSNWPSQLKITDLMCEHKTKTTVSASKKRKRKASVPAKPVPIPSGSDAVGKIAEDVQHHLDVAK
eukprot:10235425-Karenia_brevis.AAC.1